MKNKNEEILQVLEEKRKCKNCNSELILIENDINQNDYAYCKNCAQNMGSGYIISFQIL